MLSHFTPQGLLRRLLPKERSTGYEKSMQASVLEKYALNGSGGVVLVYLSHSHGGTAEVRSLRLKRTFGHGVAYFREWVQGHPPKPRAALSPQLLSNTRVVRACMRRM